MFLFWNFWNSVKEKNSQNNGCRPTKKNAHPVKNIQSFFFLELKHIQGTTLFLFNFAIKEGEYVFYPWIIIIIFFSFFPSLELKFYHSPMKKILLPSTIIIMIIVCVNVFFLANPRWILKELSDFFFLFSISSSFIGCR